ncbi:hypothetical protein FRB94_006995 [Tulasnella sp. JGI-2019a]|nr:hypothetical protein FRB94_006995 [Tulasnella sp. JGI-2019a]
MASTARKDRCHQVLLLHETLVQIFRHCSHPTLAAAAVVCWAWSEPVLEILWEEVWLGDFLKLLGGVIWADSSVRSDKRYAEKNIDRLILYGSWIKMAHLSDRLHDTFVDKLCTAITYLSRPLLPQLRDLKIHYYCNAPKETDMSHPLIFAGPMLRKLSLTSTYGKTTTAFHTQLPTLSPFLEELVLSIDVAVETSVFGVAEMLAHLPALRLVDIRANALGHNIDAIISTLASHQHLEELRIWNMQLVSSYSVPAPFRGFASLRRLSSTWCRGISSFLMGLSPTSHPTYIAVIDAFMAPYTLEEFFQAVSAFNQLECLIVQGQKDDSGVPSVEILGPLRSCSALETLEITLEYDIPINDDDLEALVSYLPRLINIKLGRASRRTSMGRSHLTLRALTIIATSCPMIRFVSVNLDASRNVALEMVYHPTLLERIDVQGSYIEDRVAVALFLARLPASNDLYLWHNGCRKEWEEVEEILFGFQDARRL